MTKRKKKIKVSAFMTVEKAFFITILWVVLFAFPFIKLADIFSFGLVHVKANRKRVRNQFQYRTIPE